MSDTHKERHATLRGELQERLDLRTTYELLDLSTAPTGSYWNVLVRALAYWHPYTGRLHLCQ